jgi:hypothetical protein
MQFSLHAGHVHRSYDKIQAELNFLICAHVNMFILQTVVVTVFVSVCMFMANLPIKFQMSTPNVL